MQYLSQSLMKGQAKEIFFKCIIVYLLYDGPTSADAYLSKFMNEDTSIYGSREGDLLKDMIESAKENNVVKFRTAVTKYNDFQQLDNWKITMFNRILENIEKKANAMGDDDYR